MKNKRRIRCWISLWGHKSFGLKGVPYSQKNSYEYKTKFKNGEEKPFFEALTKLGIETRVRDLQEFYGGQKKADWDVGIVIDSIRTASLVDVIVLVSGDGDFIDLVEHLKGLGRRVEVMAFGRSCSSRLRAVADEFIDLEEKPEKYLLRK